VSDPLAEFREEQAEEDTKAALRRALGQLEKRFLVERHHVSHSLASSVLPAGAAVANDEDLSVMMNEEDHLRIISMETGGNLLSVFERLVRAIKTLEEKLIEALPLEFDSLQPEQLYAFQVLQKRKDIIQIEEKTIVSFKLTELGKQIAGREIKLDLIEELTPEIIKNWKKNKKFRSYDITSPVPAIYGGKKHFVSQAGEYARQIWRDLGFKEMTGPKVETSFWVFDALFTPQDHPAREMQDTFFIKNIPGSLPKDKALVKKVKEAHEKGLAGSKGWRYEWTEEEASKILLRTHTTAISARTLAKLDKKELPAKFFAIGRCFRNETVDWSHGFEFNQTEGIVVDKNANFRNLLGYLKEFFTKMGYEKILFRPSFFAYTEPSVEIAVWHPEKKVWLELGGAGIFRPEVVIPFFGEYIPVLAWGPGFDRSIMMNYNINDLRQVYSNDIEMLRKIKPWLK